MKSRPIKKRLVHQIARILVVDDHPIMRDGITQVINQEADLRVCAQAADAQEALGALKTHAPDLAIVDISLAAQEINGLELIKDIKNRHPRLPILVLSMHDEALYAERVLRAGARGYIMKQAPAEKLLTAIRTVLSGKIYLSDKMAEKMLQRFAPGSSAPDGLPIECLSDRELEVFQLIGQGFKPGAIAEKLHLSVKTVDSYYARIKEKMNFKSANELLRYAVQWGQSASSTRQR